MEHTSGKIEEVIECSNAIALLSKEDGSQVAQVMDEDGNDLTDTQKANAKELVRRWNAFEEGGLVEKLRTATEKAITYLSKMKAMQRLQADGIVYLEKLESAIASAEG